MKYTYHFQKESGLLIIQYKDDFSMENYIQSLKEIQSKPEWDSCFKILIDLRKLTHPRGTKIVDDLLEVRKIEKPHDYRLAYLVEHPSTIVIIHLYIDKLNDPKYKYCSTVEATVNHLRLNKTSKEINKMLQELSFN